MHAVFILILKQHMFTSGLFSCDLHHLHFLGLFSNTLVAFNGSFYPQILSKIRGNKDKTDREAAATCAFNSCPQSFSSVLANFICNEALLSKCSPVHGCSSPSDPSSPRAAVLQPELQILLVTPSPSSPLSSGRSHSSVPRHYVS